MLFYSSLHGFKQNQSPLSYTLIKYAELFWGSPFDRDGYKIRVELHVKQVENYSMKRGLLANASCNINGYPKRVDKDNIYTIQKANTPILSPPHDYINNHRSVKKNLDFITTLPT